MTPVHIPRTSASRRVPSGCFYPFEPYRTIPDWFQALFTSLLGVLFSFPSRYYCAIGLRTYLALEVGAPQLPAGIPTHGTQEHPGSLIHLTPTGLSPSTAWRSSQLRLRCFGIHTGVLQHHISPSFRMRIQFELCRFRSPLLTASQLVSFPPGTEMFQFPGFPFPYGNALISGQDLPFGNRRFLGSMRLPDAYRSLARPSSAPEPSHPPAGIAAGLPDRSQ